MSGQGGSSRAFNQREALAIATALAITFSIDCLTRLPRILLQIVICGAPTFPESNLNVCVFMAEAFICGIVTGVLALRAGRRIAPDANVARTAVISSAVMLIYALFTLPYFSAFGSMIHLFADDLPDFMPVYLELCGSLPGWILGYYFACGFNAQAEIGTISKLSFGALTSVIVALVFIAPNYVTPNIPRVQSEFHTIPLPSSTGGQDIRILPSNAPHQP